MTQFAIRSTASFSIHSDKAVVVHGLARVAGCAITAIDKYCFLDWGVFQATCNVLGLVWRTNLASIAFAM